MKKVQRRWIELATSEGVFLVTELLRKAEQPPYWWAISMTIAPGTKKEQDVWAMRVEPYGG